MIIRTFIIDDHPVVRAGIKQIIQDTGDIVVTREAGNGKEALSMISGNEFDLIILDISLPDIDGLEVLQSMKVSKPDVKVLMLSRHQEEHYAIRALKLGALGYVNKSNVAEELTRAIRSVYQGKRYITPAIAEKIIDISLFPETEKPLHSRLSEREFQVLMRLVEGKTVSECAGDLFLSTNTISTYRQRILQKLDLKTNAQLMRYAVKHNLFD